MKGIILVRWDDKIGIVMEGKYPETLVVSEDQMMRIFTTHAMGGGEAGFLSMMIENLSIASYYTGLPEEGIDQFYLALILDGSENPDQFQEALIEILQELIPARKKPEFRELLELNFKNIAKYLDLTEEQRYAFIFKSSTRILLLRKLVEGAIIKEILRKWISDRVGEEILDIDGLLMPFIKTEIVKEFKLPTEVGEETECLFLIKDVFFMRTPSDRMIKLHRDKKLPEKDYGKYFNQVKAFFKNYKLEERDAKESSELFSDPVAYGIVSLLRKDPMPKREVLQKIGVPESQFRKILKELKKKNFVKENKSEVLYLFTDITFPSFFPEYMIDSIRRRWGERNISRDLALHHLQLLKGIFQGLPAEIAMFGPKIMLIREEEERKRLEEEERLRKEEEKKIREEQELMKKAIAEKRKAKAPKAGPRIQKKKVEAPRFTKQDIKKWTQIKKDELVKIKRAIEKNLYDVALGPLERARDAIKKLIEANVEGAQEDLKKVDQLTGIIYGKLGKKRIEEDQTTVASTSSTASGDQDKLKIELQSSLKAADNATREGDFGFAIFNLEEAAKVAAKLGDGAVMDDIKMKIQNLSQKVQ
ncbi:MAG: hypothetical protein ACTSRW_08145 [Candidatus Helarchaeota archaeon]